MRLLSWNCRGLGKPQAVRELTDLVRVHKPRIVGLMETKIDRCRLDAIRQRLGFKFGVFDREGIAGGLSLWWKEGMDIQVLSYSKFHIDVWVEQNNPFRATLFYGSPIAHRRASSWNLLRQLHSRHAGPWIIFGDFNEVCFSWEVRSNRIRGEWQMRSFREGINDCGLVDLGTGVYWKSVYIFK